MSVLSQFYGRRRGRRVHKTQEERVNELLPEFTLKLPEKGKLDLTDFGERQIWLEVGFGGGEHLTAHARRNPYVEFIGCECFYNGIVSLVNHVHHLNLENVSIFPDDARVLMKALPAHSID